MKKRYSLPIEAPQFICYNYLVCSNAIVRAVVKEKAPILLCSKYINCYYKEESTKHKFIIAIFDHWFTLQKIMQYQLIDLFKETYQKKKFDLVLTIKKCLLFDSYIFGQCNFAYIAPGLCHDVKWFNYVITGFDDTAKEFTIYGVDSTENFSCYHVKYQTFIEALFDTPKSNITFTMWRYNKDISITLDLPNTIFELEDYTNSTNRRKHYTADKVYGLNAIQKLSEHFYETAQNGLELNEFYLHKFLMHKSYMKDRMECLASHDVIDQKWIAHAEQVSQIGEKVYNFGKSFNDSHDQSFIAKLVEMIADTIRSETDYLPKVLEELKQYSQNK